MHRRRENKKNKTSNKNNKKEASSHSVTENPVTNNSELPRSSAETDSSSGVEPPQSTKSLRIADLDLLFRQFQALEQHSDRNCGIFHFEINGTKTEGTKFGWEFECRKCGFKKIVYSEENDNRNPEVVMAESLINYLFSR